MAINTSGYRVQLPPIAQIPSNLGAIDIGAGQQSLLRGMQISKAAFGDPIAEAEKMRNYRTLLARAKQEDELREQDTRAKRARLLSEEQIAPMETELAKSRNQLSGQRVEEGEMELEAARAEQPTKLLASKVKGEELSFRAGMPVAARVFGPSKRTTTQLTRLPTGALEEATESTIETGGDMPYVAATEIKTGAAPLHTSEEMPDAEKQGYVPVTVRDQYGNVSTKLVPSRVSAQKAVFDSIDALDAAADKAEAEGNVEEANRLRAQAEAKIETWRQMRAPSSQAASMQAANEIERLTQKKATVGLTEGEEAKLAKLKGKEDTNAMIQNFLGGGKPAKPVPASGKQATRKFKVVEE